LHGDIPASLHHKVRVYCLGRGISIGALMVELLEAHFEAIERKA